MLKIYYDFNIKQQCITKHMKLMLLSDSYIDISKIKLS